MYLPQRDLAKRGSPRDKGQRGRYGVDSHADECSRRDGLVPRSRNRAARRSHRVSGGDAVQEMSYAADANERDETDDRRDGHHLDQSESTPAERTTGGGGQ